METPTVFVEKERVNSSPSFPRRHKLLFGLVVTIGVLVYAAFNLWVYQYSKSGKASSPAALWQVVTKSTTGFPGMTGRDPVTPSPLIPTSVGIQSKITPTPIPTPIQTPTPTPAPTSRPTGPGEYACDPYGVCNRYGDAARKEFCPVTYADSRCLGQCGDKGKQCKN